MVGGVYSKLKHAILFLMTKKAYFFLLALIIFVSAAGFLNFYKESYSAISNTPPGKVIKDYAWSSNIGWISLSSENNNDPFTYGVSVNFDENSPQYGWLSGYGWSPHVGWISFRTEDTAGCPQAPCQAKFEGGRMVGWAKAMQADNNGWDGWISFGGVTGQGTTYGPTLNGDSFTGYPWGHEVMGWIDFSFAHAAKGASTTATCAN